VAIGAAFTTSDVPEGIAGLRGQTVLSQNFFSSSDFLVNGTRRRTGIEFEALPGPASVKAEWMRVETQRRGESVEDTDLSPLVGQGWYVSGTYVLTGERKADGLDIPRRPLPRGGPGAIELAVRLERLAFGTVGENPDAATSPRAEVVRGNADRALTFGVNWHPSRWVKLQTNVVYETLADASAGPLPAKGSFWSQVFRLQLAL